MCCIFLAMFTSGADAQCVTSFDNTKDYFPDKIAPDHAEHFNISYHLNYKVLENTAKGETYVLTQCGTTAPEATNFPGAKFFEVPLKKVGLESTTDVPFLEMLGVRTAVTRMNLDFVTSPCMNKLGSEGKLKPLESSWGNATIRMEQMVELDAVLSGFKPDEAKTIAFTASSDPGPLHRAEWIEFVAALFNKEKEANKLFGDLKVRYACHKLAVSKMTKPLVAWVNHDATYGTCTGSFVDKCPWSIETTPYKLDYVTAAGGTPLKPTGAITFNNSADFLAAVADVDILIDMSYDASKTDYALQSTKYDFPLASAADAPAYIKNKQVYRSDKSGKVAGGEWGGYADDWLESALAEPDVVQHDLLSIIQPDYMVAGHETRWFRNTAAGKDRKLLLVLCGDTSKVLPPRGSTGMACVATDTDTPQESIYNAASTMATTHVIGFVAALALTVILPKAI